MYCHKSAPRERGRPQNPFQSPEQISFPFSGLSVLPSSLPLLATLFLILFGMPHALCSVLFRQGGTFPFISYSSLGPPAVFVAGSPRSHSDSVTWPQIAISRLPPWLPHLGHLFLLGGEPFVSVHGHLPPLSPSLCGRRFIRKRTCSRHVTSEAEEERRGDGNE